MILGFTFVQSNLRLSDNLSALQHKMREYIGCGVKLGWLINPDDRQVEIYRPGKDTEILYERRIVLLQINLLPF